MAKRDRKPFGKRLIASMEVGLINLRMGGFLIRDLFLPTASPIGVVRHVRGKFRPEVRRDPARRAERKRAYRDALAAFARAKNDHDFAMSGGHGYSN